ncbi:polysaccharide deacetylase family protein [Elusimicrobiota bacterium]
MSRLVSIVMYHYVRDLAHSRYPEIKGLSTDLFEGQIAYFRKHYNVISAYDLMDAVENGADLPPRSLLLTFDDAYADHFTDVFPILDREKLPGCFFPPAKTVVERRVLQVNKIHFVLASVKDKSVLVDSLRGSLDENRSAYRLDSNEHYWADFGVASRHDPPEVMFIKSMLQRELPRKLRHVITDELFGRFVSSDEESFSAELYMSLDQIACLQRNGMYVGSHGSEHSWLNTISKDEQEREIDLSLRFLDKIGSDTKRWIMCYPFGAHNESLLALLKERNCAVGLTTEVRIADLGQDDPLTLPRLDTNDFPKDPGAEANEWTRRVPE